MRWGLQTADTAVLIGYLVCITLLGLWMARRVHNIGDFFMPRRFGKAMMVMHTFGTGRPTATKRSRWPPRRSPTA